MAKQPWRFLNDNLKGRTWLVGDHVSIADIDLYGTVRYAPEGGFDLSAYPHVQAWMKQFEALDGFHQPDVLMPAPKA